MNEPYNNIALKKKESRILEEDSIEKINLKDVQIRRKIM